MDENHLKGVSSWTTLVTALSWIAHPCYLKQKALAIYVQTVVALL